MYLLFANNQCLFQIRPVTGLYNFQHFQKQNSSCIIGTQKAWEDNEQVLRTFQPALMLHPQNTPPDNPLCTAYVPCRNLGTLHNPDESSALLKAFFADAFDVQQLTPVHKMPMLSTPLDYIPRPARAQSGHVSAQFNSKQQSVSAQQSRIQKITTNLKDDYVDDGCNC